MKCELNPFSDCYVDLLSKDLERLHRIKNGELPFSSARILFLKLFGGVTEEIQKTESALEGARREGRCDDCPLKR